MRNAAITADFGDGTYKFRLGWGELIQLQEACDAGPYVVLNRLGNETWKVQDISHVIRFGLIGGGMEPVPALKMARQWVESRPPIENIFLAQAVLSAGIVGAPDEEIELKKKEQTKAG